jgi:hypothetical protein
MADSVSLESTKELTFDLLRGAFRTVPSPCRWTLLGREEQRTRTERKYVWMSVRNAFIWASMSSRSLSEKGSMLITGPSQLSRQAALSIFSDISCHSTSPRRSSLLSHFVRCISRTRVSFVSVWYSRHLYCAHSGKRLMMPATESCVVALCHSDPNLHRCVAEAWLSMRMVARVPVWLRSCCCRMRLNRTTTSWLSIAHLPRTPMVSGGQRQSVGAGELQTKRSAPGMEPRDAMMML